MLNSQEASFLVDSTPRARANFGCRDTDCCPRGVIDMQQNKTRHFLYQRIQQILEMSRIPETLRTQIFLERHLRPTTDKILAATKVNWPIEATANKFQKHRKRLDSLRVALGNYAQTTPPRFLQFCLKPEARGNRRNKTPSTFQQIDFNLSSEKNISQ